MIVESPIPEHPCPVCGEQNDAVMSDSDDGPPQPGDLSVCVYCLSVGVFQPNGSVRLATTEECELVPEWLRKEMKKMVPRHIKPS